MSSSLHPLRPRRWSRFVRLAAALGLGGWAVLLGGCALTGLDGRKCTVVFLIDGHQVRPTYKQFQEVDKALGPSMAQKGYVLIHDLHEAEFVATVEVAANPTDPGRMNLILKDVTENDILRLDDARFSPSIIESNREHNDAFRGFTRPGD